MEQLALILGPLLSAYVGDFGVAVQIVSIVGTLRLFFKPIMAGVEQAIKDSPSQEDDIILGKVQKNIFYKGFIFVLDLVSSIKIKK
jgi:hypothetical protein